MKKLLKFLFAGLLVIFLVIQFIRPERVPQGSMDAHLFTVEQVPADVSATLKNACFDCHSNNIRYPWYSNIAPISWSIADHIKEGREHLNFSEWANYSSKDQAEAREEIIEEVQEGNMPMKGYVALHSEADLSAAQIDALVKWANGGTNNSTNENELQNGTESSETTVSGKTHKDDDDDDDD